MASGFIGKICFICAWLRESAFHYYTITLFCYKMYDLWDNMLQLFVLVLVQSFFYIKSC